jgi:acyl-coenzyme A thioesterase PaaI-like protein
MATITEALGGVAKLADVRPDVSVSGLYQMLSSVPLGKHLFTRAVCFKAPYFGSIDPLIVDLRPGRCEVHAGNKRAVRNHLGTVHAIAMCNMAELAGGMLTEVSVPRGHRWIPTGMTVEYLAKARTDLRAIAELDPLPDIDHDTDLPVDVRILDDADSVVMRATITMRVSPRR